MERFDSFEEPLWLLLFFSLLRERLYSHTDNLSKDLQGTKVAAVSGQRLENLTKETLTKIPTSDQIFDHFYANFFRKSESLFGAPTLPRKRCTPARLHVGAGAPSYPQTTKDQFRKVCYEAIGLIVGLSISALIRKASAPTPRWSSPWLKLLMVTTVRQSSSFLKHHTAKMLIQGCYLGVQLSILEVMLKEKISCVDESCWRCQSFQNHKRS